MKQVVKVLSAPWMMGALLVILAAAMAMATFVENDYGTPAARHLVYSAWWFEGIFLLLAINMLGNIFNFQMWQRRKLPVLLFHLSFFLILLGAALTRYVGYEGLMHIREGESEQQMLSYDPHLTLEWQSADAHIQQSKPALLSPATPHAYKGSISTPSGKIKVRSLAFIPNSGHAHEGSTQPHAVVLEVRHQGERDTLMVYGRSGQIGAPLNIEFPKGSLQLRYGALPIDLPFSVRLKEFILERYPGSESPSGYRSEVQLTDHATGKESEHSIFMNNILNHRGYRLYQSSYDTDERGTILSVNRDGAGTLVTYIGYFLMSLGMFWALFAPGTRFRILLHQVDRIHRQRRKLVGLVLLLLLPLGALAQRPVDLPPAPDAELAAEFGSLWVLDRGGRIKPLNSLHQEIALKLVKHHSFRGRTADQLILGFFSHPAEWQRTPLITVKEPELRRLLQLSGPKAAFADFFDAHRHYRIQPLVEAAYRKNPSERNKLDQEAIKVDEQVNVFYLTQAGELHQIFPTSADRQQPWYTPVARPTTLSPSDSAFVTSVLSNFIQQVRNNDRAGALALLDEVRTYQESHAAELLPGERRLRMELLYNRLSIFLWLSTVLFGLGAFLLLLQFVTLLKPRWQFKTVMRIGFVLILLGFLYYSFGMGLRWYLAGRAPWSNGYETMVFVGWTILFAAFVFVRKSPLILPISALFAGLVLMIAHLSWMNPQITNLVPVLQSYWLTLHVSIITAGYGFLALGALLGFLSLLIVIVRTPLNYARLQLSIQELTAINELSLTAGLYLMTIGSFLGGVWANESWGRYWGWDPKETWSLITIIVYAFVLHMRFIPGMRGQLAFNSAAMVSIASVIMTYLGVNYYLAGMHSYAGGDPVPIPAFVYYSAAVFVLLIAAARYNESRLRTKVNPLSKDKDF